MAERYQIYRCEVCGNIIGVLHGSKGELVCCGEPMTLVEANTVDAAVEKHVPVMEKADGGVRVKVGSVPHPMQDEHYIEWIQVRNDGMSCLKFLDPGDEPEALFPIESEELAACEYCNIHGLWKKEG